MYFPDNVRAPASAEAGPPTSKGHLNPGDPELSFERFELGAELSELVRHVWIVRWDVPPGEVRPQRVLTYPAFNAAIEPGTAALYGPHARVRVQELRGRSWVVGVLFRPAAGPLLTRTDPAELAGASEPLPGAPRAGVEQIMESSPFDRAALARVLQAWLGPLAARVDDRGRIVNLACRIAEEDPEMLRAVDLAARVGLTPRSLERLTRRHIGVTPKWLIECRRLQHAATTLFREPDTNLSGLAAELGYTDYAHFSRQYRRVLGESPRQTRDHGRRRSLRTRP